jgi:hypothetical protein
MNTTVTRRIAASLCALTLLASVAAFAPQATFAQGNVIERHPNASAVATGVATHHALKVAARNAKRHGKKLNWAERHPTLSALGAATAVHHYGTHTGPIAR